jgi:hypothetical protein
VKFGLAVLRGSPACKSQSEESMSCRENQVVAFATPKSGRDPPVEPPKRTTVVVGKRKPLEIKHAA